MNQPHGAKLMIRFIYLLMLIARVRHDRYSISARDVVTLKRSLQLQCCTHRNDNTVRSFAGAGLYEHQLQRQQLQLRYA